MIGSLYFLFMLSSNHGFQGNVQPKDVSATSGRQTSTLNFVFDFCSNYSSKMHHFGAMGMEQTDWWTSPLLNSLTLVAEDVIIVLQCVIRQSTVKNNRIHSAAHIQIPTL